MKKLRMLSSLLIAFVMMMALSVDVKAQKTYKIRFLAGSQGTFENGTSVAKDFQPQELPDWNYYAAQLKVKDGYYFRGWNYSMKPATKSTSYVAQYRRVVNSVSYRIRFVNKEGNEIGTSIIGHTEKGNVIAANAVNIENYAVDQATKSKKIEKDSDEIVFVYTSTLQPNVETRVVNNIVTVANPVAVTGGTTTNRTANQTTGGTTTGGTTTGGTTTTTNPPAGTTEGQGTEEINPNETPQGQLKENKTPAGQSATLRGHFALVNLIATVLTITIALFTLTGKSEKETTMLKAFNLILAIVATGFFFFTEDLTKSMTMVDSYTITSVILALASGAIMFVKTREMTKRKN